MSPLLTTTAIVICPHAGQALLLPSQTEAVVRGAPVLLQTERHPIVGCVFAPGGVPSPCLSIQWVTAALKAKVHQIPVLLQTSVGLCLNAAQAPQGAAIVVQTQTEALGE
jgi:hypothetical protein